MPGLAAVPGGVDAAIVAFDQAIGITRIDPQCVMIRMYAAADDARGLAPVVGKHDVEREEIDLVLVIGRNQEMPEIERTRVQQVVVADLCPMLAVVGGIPQHSFFRFDQRIHMLGIAGCNRQPNSSDGRLGQATTQLLPALAAVGRAIESAAVSAADHHPGIALRLPHARVQDHRIGRIHDQIAGAGLVVDVQDFFPRATAVGAAEDSALGVGSPCMSEGSDEDHFGIRGAHDNGRNLPDILKPHRTPAGARIGREEHTTSG